MKAFLQVCAAWLMAVCIWMPSQVFALDVRTGLVDDLRVMFLFGEFTSQDDGDALARSIEAFGPDLVTFDSPGGNIYAAMRIGRTIRSYGVATLQLRGMECASACALAFLGGAERHAEPGSIGMHKAFFGDRALSAEEAVSAVQTATADVLAYLVDMGVDPSLLRLALRYESWDMRYLSASEMAEHRVVTSHRGGDFARPRPADPVLPVARQTPMPEPGHHFQTVEDARSGLVRRPQGHASVMAAPDAKAEELRTLGNGTPVVILGTNEPPRACRRLRFLSRMEPHEQDDEQISA